MRLHKEFELIVFWKTDRDGGSASSQLFSALKFEEMQHRSLHIFLSTVGSNIGIHTFFYIFFKYILLTYI